MMPLVIPMQFMMEYNVPAKFGAKSCAFCRFVIAAAPFAPNEAVIRATHAVELSWKYIIAINNNPGMMWAGNEINILIDNCKKNKTKHQSTHKQC